jgi:MinD superfamily P-loop ATPase
MIIAVASGKGGVGKSMLASSLAFLFSKEKKITAIDCDVDAPDLGLWMGIKDWDSSEKISVSEKAFIDREKCTLCGKCRDVCRFGALKYGERPEIIPYLCEGCGLCMHVCPEKAIRVEPVQNGEVMIRETRYGFPLVSGQLYPGETGSGKVVDDIRERAKKFGHELTILDSAAGIGCPVIASLKGTDHAVLITEPTPSGFSDLKRVLEVVNHFGVDYSVVINKWDINKEMSRKIEKFAGGKLIGKISFDKSIFKAVSDLTPIMETDLKAAGEIGEIYGNLKKLLKKKFPDVFI